jgi:chromosome partitioning protein
VRTIALANQKGGCSKTSTVVNLGAALSERGYKILVVDLDPQANATYWLGGPAVSKSALQFLTDNGATPVIEQTSVEDVFIVAGSSELSNYHEYVTNVRGAGVVLTENLFKLRADWDFILIDTPPTLGLITECVLSAARELLVPVAMQTLSLDGVVKIINKIREMRKNNDTEIEILGLLATRFDSRTNHSKEVIKLLTDYFGSQVFDTVIRENICLAEAPSFKKSILSYAPKSNASTDFRALATEVISRKAVNRGRYEISQGK